MMASNHLYGALINIQADHSLKRPFKVSWWAQIDGGNGDEFINKFVKKVSSSCL